MKNTFYTIILILNCLNSFGQKVVFKGILYEHNSKTNTGKIKTLQNAQIIIPYSVPTTTDNAGKFKTETDAYKVGQSTKITVRKAGYEVVNIKDLDNVIAGNLDDVKIYLAPQNLLYEAQMKYYNLAKKSVENSYDKKLNTLLVELQKNKKIYQFPPLKKIQLLFYIKYLQNLNLFQQYFLTNLEHFLLRYLFHYL